MLLLYMMVRWFGDVIRESEGGKYGRWEDISFRWGMSFFIFSEVMFFAAFFGALFWARVYLGARPGHHREQRAAVARLHRALALGRPGLPGGVPDHGRLGPAGDQHRAAADLRRDGHHRALGADPRTTGRSS